jgi:hypothetical protein
MEKFTIVSLSIVIIFLGIKIQKMDRYVQEMNENVQKMHTLVIESTDLNKDIMRENRSLKTNCRQY